MIGTWESTFAILLKAWTPAMAEARRGREAVAPVRNATGPDTSKPCVHGMKFVSDCRACMSERERELDALDPSRITKRYAMQKKYRNAKKRKVRGSTEPLGVRR